jgi:hypothetical protein
MKPSGFPRSRQHGLIVDQVGDETIVFDEERREAHSLNRLASVVWRHCDGATSISYLAELVGEELGLAVNEGIVDYALDMLDGVHLMQKENDAAAEQVSRREVVRRMAAASVAAAR